MVVLFLKQALLATKARKVSRQGQSAIQAEKDHASQLVMFKTASNSVKGTVFSICLGSHQARRAIPTPNRMKSRWAML